MKCNANNLIQRSHAVNSENNLSKSGHHILYMHTYHTWTKIFHLSLYSLPTLGVALVDLVRMTNLISIEAGASIQDLEFGTILKKAPQRQNLGLWD